VDDEPLARRRVRSLLANEPELDILGEAVSGEAAVNLALELRPELLFLDVQMSGIDGFGVLEAVFTEYKPAVIFVTAFDKYAVRAFETHAVDYLLKPYKRERFAQALSRAKERIRRRDGSQTEAIGSLLAQVQQGPQRVVIRSAGRIVILHADEIDWVEAAANYVEVRAGGVSYTVRDSISTFQRKLPTEKFVRIHRSYIVNADRIRELQPCNGCEYIVALRNGKELPLGRTYRDEVETFLQLDR